MARQTKAKKPVQEAKTKAKKSRLARILSTIAFYFLLISGILVIAMSKIFSQIFSEAAETTVNPSYFVISGLIWLVLAFVVKTTVKRIENSNEQSYKWFLFAISFIAMISGRLESGVLLIISAIIYLRKKQ